MAQFTNQAQLTYSNGVVNSNIAVGEVLEVLSATKTATRSTYARGDNVTYIISVINSGTAPVTNVTINDNLGTYTFGTGTLTPEAYVADSVYAYVNGTLTATPTVTENADGSVTFSGITIPAGGSLVLVYETAANDFAPPIGTGIVNTATITGDGISTPITVTDTVTPSALPELTITKSIEPVPVAENGTVTYRFVIQNYGNADATATDNVVLTDTFNPILTGLTVTYDGTALPVTTGYTYNETTGAFATVAGQITVPAATFTQDATTGAYTVTPGVGTLLVTGTI